MYHYENQEVFNINDLVIEVTRRCNMSCDHCLRGDAQNKDIDIAYIESLIKQVNYIHAIAFTGGEPSLNVSAIEQTLNLCKQYNVSVGSFYMPLMGKILV